jgi:hopanoid-associated phosphorylase
MSSMSALTEAIQLGIITGLQKEAACLRAGSRRSRAARSRHEPMIFAAAGQPKIAAQVAKRMIDEGASGLLSFGIAGGLDPSLGPGVVVVATQVVRPDGKAIDCHEPWISKLLVAGAGFDSGPILGSDDAVMTTARKAALYREYNCLAVDMESHAVATVAQKAGVPFIALRAVGDPAGRAIPPAALAGLSPDGRTRALPVLAALMQRPKDAAALIRLARDTNAALASLRRVAGMGLIGLLAEG